MLHAKDYRRQAWEKLRGKWGTAALATLVQSLILGACAALSYVYVGGVALFLITGPLALGYTVLALHVIRAKEARVENLFSGFRNFGAAFLVNLINGIIPKFPQTKRESVRCKSCAGTNGGCFAWISVLSGGGCLRF